MKNAQTVALVPAFNEEPRLASVLDVIVSSPQVDKTIVIDDGSRDNTAGVAATYPVEVLRLAANRGKGAALQAGLALAPGAAYYLFLDADLLNFRHEHISALLKPLQDNENVAMSVGVFRCGHKKSVNLAQQYFSILNGQRGLRRSFVEILPDLDWSRFGVEILLSRYAALAGLEVAQPALQGISHVTKEEKLGFLRGFDYRLQMFRECLYALYNYKKMIRRYPGNTPTRVLAKISGHNNFGTK